jgi:hypothetical protein
VPAGLTPQTLGFPLDSLQATPSGQFYGIPNIQISSYATGFNGFGQTSGTPNGSNIRHFEIGDTMTLVRGNHTFNWGGNYTRTIIIQLTSQSERGQYSFDGTFTQDPLADFLLGLPRNLSRTIQTANPIEHENQSHTHFGDTWKLRRMTVIYGLSYSYNGRPYKPTGIQSFFVGPIDGVPRIQFVFGGDPAVSAFADVPQRGRFRPAPRHRVAAIRFAENRSSGRAGRFHSLLTWNDRFNDAIGPPFQVQQSFQNPLTRGGHLARGLVPALIGGATSMGQLPAPWTLDAAVTVEFQHPAGTWSRHAGAGQLCNIANHLDIWIISMPRSRRPRSLAAAVSAGPRPDLPRETGHPRMRHSARNSKAFLGGLDGPRLLHVLQNRQRVGARRQFRRFTFYPEPV